MGVAEELPSGDVEFVDAELFNSFADSEEERQAVLVRPVARREAFISTLSEYGVGENSREVGELSVYIELSTKECATLLWGRVVEAIEVPRPL